MLHSRIFPFNPLGTNCVVFWANRSTNCTVVDPGMSTDEGAEQLMAFFRSEGLTPEAILLTHGHFDHCWGVERLLAHYPVPVYLHPADKETLRKGPAVFQGMQSFKKLRHDFPTEPLSDGQQLHLSGAIIQVIHTPGHTPGSVCFWSEDNNFLLSGDTLFAGSIGRTDLDGGDYDALMDSIREKLLLLPGDTDVVPGHGQPTSIAREGMSNPFLQPFNEPDYPWWNQDGISLGTPEI